MPQTVVITGASDGIGAASARQLAAQGERVVIVGRSPEKTAAVARELGDAPYFLADFAKLSDVKRLASDLLERFDHIDVLVNNAGGIMRERRVTEDGHEMTLQVNHLAPFLLTTLLMPTLVASRAKVIVTSSIASYRLGGAFDIQDLENEQHYAPNRAYGNAKLANVLFAQELQRRFGPAGLSAVSFHPGNVASNFAHDSTSILRYVYATPLKHLLLISREKGGQALTDFVLGEPGKDWEPGHYYEAGKIADKKIKNATVDNARMLWERSEELLLL